MGVETQWLVAVAGVCAVGTACVGGPEFVPGPLGEPATRTYVSSPGDSGPVSADSSDPCFPAVTVQATNGVTFAAIGRPGGNAMWAEATRPLGEVGTSTALAEARVRFVEPTEVQLLWNFLDGGVCVITDSIGSIVAGGEFFDVAAGEDSIVLLPGTVYVFRVQDFDSTATFAFGAQIVWNSGDTHTADCDGNMTLNIDDIDCFVSAFMSDSASADCTGDGVLNIDDIDCFVYKYLNCCP